MPNAKENPLLWHCHSSLFVAYRTACLSKGAKLVPLNSLYNRVLDNHSLLVRYLAGIANYLSSWKTIALSKAICRICLLWDTRTFHLVAKLFWGGKTSFGYQNKYALCELKCTGEMHRWNAHGEASERAIKVGRKHARGYVFIHVGAGRLVNKSHTLSLPQNNLYIFKCSDAIRLYWRHGIFSPYGYLMICRYP